MKKILDVCCASRMCWFDKNNPNALFNDIRDCDYTLCDGRNQIIELFIRSLYLLIIILI